LCGSEYGPHKADVRQSSAATPKFAHTARQMRSRASGAKELGNWDTSSLSGSARFLARVAQRRVDLDVEASRGLGVEIGIGAEAAGMDAVDGAEVVDFVDVAGYAE